MTTSRPLITSIEGYMPNRRLELLKEDIAECHRRVDRHANQALRFALEAGELLIEAKTLVPYGQWSDWLERNRGEMQITMARIYMRLATYKDAIMEAEAPSMRAAMQLIAGQPNQTGLEAQRREAVELRRENPQMPVREIARSVDASFATVQGWLNPHKLEQRNDERRTKYVQQRSTITCPHCGHELYRDGTKPA